MKNRKRERKKVIELPNQESIGTVGENANYKSLGILEEGIIKQAETKEIYEKRIFENQENFSKLNFIAEISSKRQI